jgi:colicin import membrane protein
MAKLAGKAEEQRQSAALESLRQKVIGGKAGMPSASGTQAGSDYTAYLHSRLKDAFRETISFQSKAPFVVVRLTIDADGRIVRTRIERSSGDKMFENAVQRAITLAEQRIVPPPGRITYEGSFVFKPQGVTQR